GVVSPSAPMLEVDGLSRHFGALAALNGVSFEVRPGEIFSVIGPNGAGKSTLFNVISGLHAPTAGRVRFRGDDITGLSPEIINRRGVAKTFQITNIFPEISVVENVRVACQSRTTVAGRLASLWRRPDVDDRVGALLDAFGLSARRDELAENLSHGEQRYLEICLALATEPTLLLLDEPTAGMTPGETRDAVALLGKNGMGKTTLMKTAMGFLRPWRGTIEFDGQSLIGLRPHEIARRGVGLVPENRRIFPGLTVRENLELGLSAVRGRSSTL